MIKAFATTVLITLGLAMSSPSFAAMHHMMKHHHMMMHHHHMMMHHHHMMMHHHM